jgi:hypothetical protein
MLLTADVVTPLGRTPAELLLFFSSLPKTVTTIEKKRDWEIKMNNTHTQKTRKKKERGR